MIWRICGNIEGNLSEEEKYRVLLELYKKLFLKNYKID